MSNKQGDPAMLTRGATGMNPQAMRAGADFQKRLCAEQGPAKTWERQQLKVTNSLQQTLQW